MGMFDGFKKLVRGANAEAGPMGWDNTTQKQWSGAPADESESGKTFESSNAMKWDNVKNAPATDDPASELVQPGDTGEDTNNLKQIGIALHSPDDTHEAGDEDASTLVMKEGETAGEMVKMGSEASFESDSAAEAEGLDELGDV